ncbi:helix-turn-helix domain-containing protein [Amycolatopsis sacchari]|uniref:helix-turn-helix domain-containing protein n=1 Tax=Amycolatopsis TaxID=1813 RepID=UPI003CCBC6C4
MRRDGRRLGSLNSWGARSTVYKWLARHREEGEAGLVDRYSRPHHSPTHVSAETEAAILALRQRCHRGAVFIAGRLGLVASIVGRVLRRHQVPPLSAMDPITGMPVRRRPHWQHLARSLHRPRPTPPVHQTRLPLDQRRSRTLRPHPAHRIRLRPTLDLQHPPPDHPAACVQHYNTERPHSALQGHPPITRLP